VETSTSIPAVGTALADDPVLADLLSGPVPYASAYLAVGRTTESSAKEAQLAWRALRDQLHAAGAGPEVLAALDAATIELPREGGLGVVVAADGHVVAEEHPAPEATSFAWVGSVPVLGPFLRVRQTVPAHVVALVDRAGADLLVVGGWQDRGHVETVGTEGSGDGLLHKSAPGGWSQRRYQQRTENLWKLHAGEVADRLVDLVAEHHPRLVLLAGDVRALAELRAQLPAAVAERCREVSGSRHPDGSADASAEEVRRLVRTAHAEDLRAVLAAHRDAMGRGARASSGVAATAEALGRSAVATLLVHDPTIDAKGPDPRTAWSLPDGVTVAARRHGLTGVEAGTPVEGPLVDVLARAALLTGARVCLVPDAPSLHEGVGALLRY
jgi:hypothetical protein